MANDIVNLYIIKNGNCPKCKILKDKCESSTYITHFTDFKIIEIELGDETDTAYQLFIEKGIDTMPILQINNDLKQFKEAMDFLNKTDTQYKGVISVMPNNFNIIKNDNVEKIEKALYDNGGYCPCKIQKSHETKCICEEFKSQTTEGNCHCGLYRKVKI